MKTPTYDRIRRLADQLRQETKLKERRSLGEQLLQLLSKDDIRKKLAIEAMPERARPDDYSLAAQRCHALAQLWTLVIHGAISVAQTTGTGKGKGKRTLADVTLPKRLLMCCDKPDEAFDNDGLEIPKLSKKTVRNILNYCLNMLADESVLEMDECEKELLDMLNLICQNEKYVGFFKYHADFSNIMNELSQRINIDMEKENPRVFNLAAKTLDGLFRSCRRMGIQMHIFLRDSMGMMGEWCRGHIRGHASTSQSSSNDLPLLYNAMASLLYAHPEHAIGPMKRYGRSLLSYCKRCYPSATLANKDALNNYLLAHL